MSSVCRSWSTSSWRQLMASYSWCLVRLAALFTSPTPWHPSSTSHSLNGSAPPFMISSTQMTQRSWGSSSLLQRITTQVQSTCTHWVGRLPVKSVSLFIKNVVTCALVSLHPWLIQLHLLFAFKGRMLDLKTGTVKKESQQSSARMTMGARRSFICRMRCDFV